MTFCIIVCVLGESLTGMVMGEWLLQSFDWNLKLRNAWCRINGVAKGSI